MGSKSMNNLLLGLCTIALIGCGGTSSNQVAFEENGDACLEENADLLKKGWSKSRLIKWCGLREEDETWHDRMVADVCAKCVECCVEVIDEEKD